MTKSLTRVSGRRMTTISRIQSEIARLYSLVKPVE